MKILIDILLSIIFLSILGTFVLGGAWILDDEISQVKTGKKLPSTTILPIVHHDPAGNQ